MEVSFLRQFLAQLKEKNQRAEVVVGPSGATPPALDGLFEYPPRQIKRDVLENEALLLSVAVDLGHPSMAEIKTELDATQPSFVTLVQVGLALQANGDTRETLARRKGSERAQLALATVEELKRRYPDGKFSLYVYYSLPEDVQVLKIHQEDVAYSLGKS